jgi:hypothetical protein
MKRFIYLLPFLIPYTRLTAQTVAPATSEPAGATIKKYISAGISIGNVNSGNESSNSFSKASFPAIEGGIIWKKSTLGLVLGCENFFATPGARIFYELKTTYSIPIEEFSIYGLFGTGAYFEKRFNNFIEYGAGVSYNPNSFSYFVQYSNWANNNYVSVGAMFSF